MDIQIQTYGAAYRFSVKHTFPSSMSKRGYHLGNTMIWWFGHVVFFPKASLLATNCFWMTNICYKRYQCLPWSWNHHIYLHHSGYYWEGFWFCDTCSRLEGFVTLGGLSGERLCVGTASYAIFFWMNQIYIESYLIHRTCIYIYTYIHPKYIINVHYFYYTILFLHLCSLGRNCWANTPYMESAWVCSYINSFVSRCWY